MKLEPIEFLPGLFTLKTDRGAKNRWIDGDHVRFFRGMPEKLKGWTRTITDTFLGKARSSKDWQSLAFLHYMALGTHLKLYVQKGGEFYDITPLASSGTLGADPFTMTSGLPTVSVADAAHGVSAGDYVHYSGATASNGITISGEYTVTSVTDADNYVITHTSNASGTGAGGGGAVAYAYEISVGNEDTVQGGRGWGVGAWGASTWGTARSATNLVNLCRIWTLDNWGEDLIACPRGGKPYVWDTSTGTGSRAAAISGAPTTALGIVVSEQDRHLIAFGAHDGSTSDPLLIRWCDQEDYTAWTPSATNTAGRKRLDGGNEIYCAVKTGNEILVHTDGTLTLMRYAGPPYTFDFESKGSNGGLRGPNACKAYDGRAFWIGKNDFYVYDGRVRVLPCDVHNHVFDDISTAQQAKIFAGANEAYGEIWWLYPSANSTECDRYVIYNALENHWSFGTLSRTVFVGDSKIFNTYAAGTDGYIYDHDSGVDANGAALESSLSSWAVEIGDGDQVMHVGRIVPDFKRLDGSVTMTMTGKKKPQSSRSTTKTLSPITETTEELNPKMRARQIAFTLETSAIGDDWRMGTLRIGMQPDGGQ